MTSYAISEGDFVKILEDMRAHSHKCIAQGVHKVYTPSKHVEKAYYEYNFIPPLELDALDDFEANLKKDTKPDAEKLSNSTENDITSITNQYKADATSDPKKAEPNFVESMNKSRDTAKANADKAIDKAYDTAIAYGINKPEGMQKKILAFTSTITGGITAIVAKITEFVVNAVKKVVEWIKTAIKAIEDTFSKIGSFIGHIFG